MTITAARNPFAPAPTATTTPRHDPEIAGTAPREGARRPDAPAATTTTTARDPAFSVETDPLRGPQEQVRRIRERSAAAAANGTGPGRNAAPARDFDALVEHDTALILNGTTPSLPTIPPLPHRTGAEIVAQTGMHSPDAMATYRAAVREARDLEPHNLIAFALERAGIDADEFTVGEELTAGHILGDAIEIAAEYAHAHAAVEVMGTAGALLSAIEVADAAASYLQEMVHIGRGQIAASPAVLEGLRREIPVRLQQQRARLERNAEDSFDAGARRAAAGEPMDPARGNDRAYQLGYQQGTAYRAQNGAAYDQWRFEASALAVATRRAQAELARHGQAGGGGEVVPLTSDPATVGREIRAEP